MDRILIVDSSMQNGDLIRECLTNSNNEIIVAESGLNALSKIEIFKPDLVILDADLPDVSGYDICKKIKSKTETQYILVLLMSVSVSKEARFRSIEVGADDFMEKIFDSTILKSKVKSLLRLKFLGEQLKQKLIELEEKNNILEFQLKMARHVQSSIIPKINMTFNNCLFVSKYMPALDIGGDFYDVIKLNEYCMAIIMGDVSGHGIAAALLTSMLNMLCKNLACKYAKPDKFLFYLNNEFYKAFEKTTNEMYASVYYMIIDTNSHKLYYSNAGQSLPIFVKKDENLAIELEASGLPIGLISNSEYEMKVIDYKKGDMLLFHTDGLSDIFYKDAPDVFSTKLKEILVDAISISEPNEIIDILLGSFYNYNSSDNEKLEMDDVSIVLCKM